MGYNYIEIRGSNEKLPPQQHFLFITKELSKPIKTNANKTDYSRLKNIYDESMKQRALMFESFKNGNIDLHDRCIESDDITKKIGDVVANNRLDNNIIYLIEPLIVSKHTESYSSRSTYRVHTFNIVREISSIEELFKHAHDNNYYEDFMADIFDKMRYGNEGYKENCLKWFEYAKENYPCNESKYPDCKLTLWDMVERHDLPSEEIINHMLDNEFIYLHDKYDSEASMFKKLVQHTKFEIANKYLNLVQSDYAIRTIKSDRDITAILKSNSDNQSVKEIFKTLGIEDKSVKIKIVNYNYGETSKELTFEDINKAKAYVIKNYTVDFDKVADGINGLYIEDEHGDEYRIEVID